VKGKIDDEENGICKPSDNSREQPKIKRQSHKGLLKYTSRLQSHCYLAYDSIKLTMYLGDEAGNGSGQTITLTIGITLNLQW
jgi:hypothetical protein